MASIVAAFENPTTWSMGSAGKSHDSTTGMPKILKQSSPARRVLAPGYHDCLGAAAQQLLYRSLLLSHVVVRIGQQDLQSLVRENFR